MPKLIIRKGRDIVKKLAIPEDILAFTVGSEQGNDIIISEERISYFHLQFEKQTDNYFVRDLQSKSGTYINGKRITSRTILKNNDEIGLGNHLITFVQPNQAANNIHLDNSDRENRPTKTIEQNSNLHLFFDLRELKEKISGMPKLNQLNRLLHDDSLWENHTSHFEDQPKTETTSRTNMDGQNSFPEFPDSSNHNDILPETENKNGPDGNGKLLTPQWETSEPAESTQPAITEHKSLSFEASQSEISNSNAPVELPGPQSPMVTEKETNCYLLGINGYYLGRKFRIRKSRTRIGRDQKLNDIVIRKNTKGSLDQSVSRRHATVNFKKNEYFISDKRSKTRTRLNRHVITEGEEIRIHPSDEVEIISDRKNHIFRFVKEGDWNFSYPQKAGPWHLRYRLQLLSLLTGLLVLAAGVVGVHAYLTTNYLTHENHQLTGEISTWYEKQANLAAMASPVSPAAKSYPAIADFNRDHFVDLIYIDPAGTLTSVDGKTKQVLWQNTDFQALSDIPVTIADLFDDGLPDILLVSDDLRLRAIDGIWGLEIWKSPILPGPLTGPPAIADFNHDGSKDLVIASTSGRVYIGFSHLESVNWTSLNIHTQTHSTASILHKANSRAPIILLGTEFGKLLFIDPLSKSVIREIDVNEEINKASGKFDISGAVRTPVAVADLDGDGQQDYVVTTTEGNILAMNGKTNKRLWFDVAEQQSSDAGHTSPMSVLGDMDGDGLADVATITPNGRIRAFKGTGKARDHKLILWEYPSQKQGDFIGAPVLADIDKNGRKDVLATSSDGSMSLLGGSDGHVLLKSKKALAVNGVPLIADLDNNHSIDILTLRADNQFHNLNVNSKFLAGKILFGQLYYNGEHTSYSNLVMEDSGRYDLFIGLSVFVALLAIGANGIIRKKRSQLNYY